MDKLVRNLRVLRDVLELEEPPRRREGFISGVNLAINIIRLYDLEDIEEIEDRLEKAIEYQRQKYFSDPEYKSGVIAGLEKSIRVAKIVLQGRNWVKVIKTDNGYLVLGDTYPIRNQLRELGGKWRPMRRAWFFRSNPTSELRKIGVKVIK